MCEPTTCPQAIILPQNQRLAALGPATASTFRGGDGGTAAASAVASVLSLGIASLAAPFPSCSASLAAPFPSCSASLAAPFSSCSASLGGSSSAPEPGSSLVSSVKVRHRPRAVRPDHGDGDPERGRAEPLTSAALGLLGGALLTSAVHLASLSGLVHGHLSLLQALAHVEEEHARGTVIKGCAQLCHVGPLAAGTKLVKQGMRPGGEGLGDPGPEPPNTAIRRRRVEGCHLACRRGPHSSLGNHSVISIPLCGAAGS